MNDVTDDDWVLLNAYHDGELTETQARAIEARLEVEPSLASALQQIGALSGGLSTLRPQIGSARLEQPVQANDNRRFMEWGLGGAVAAALVAGIVFVMPLLSPDSPYDIHEELAAQSLDMTKADLALAASPLSDGVPDLGGANLVPVTFRSVEGGSVAHYAGRNGCRLTYFRNALEFDLGGNGGTAQVAAWSTPDATRHAIMVSGMDDAKFAAITAYLKMLTRREADDSLVASLSEATENAAPCIG